MPFNHIGIALLDDAGRALQSGPLGFHGVRLDDEDFLPACGIAQGDGTHRVAVRARECKAVGEGGLDVNLKAAQIFEAHPFEKRASGRGEVLLDGIVGREEGSALLGEACAQVLIAPPIRERHQLIECQRTIQGCSSRRSPKKRRELLLSQGSRTVGLTHEDLRVVWDGEFHSDYSLRPIESKELLVLRKDHPLNLVWNGRLAHQETLPCSEAGSFQ